jgi:lipoprotein-anchoring transpeptidase ErfK/SrfK
MTLALALAGTPASAGTRHKPAHNETGHASKEPFGDIPKGPLQIFISIDQQKLHLYSDGVHVADSSVATGVPSLPTPLGVFSVIQKQIFHRSNIYSNAPMPFMQRITWSGVALHEGESIGHRASHGCIRMPHDFAVRLYNLTKLGARVIVTDAELKPVEFADPHLFVHKNKPADPVAAAASSRTTQTADGSKTDDAASADAAVAAKPAELGLRVSEAGVSAGPNADAAKPDPTATDAAKAEAPIAADVNPPTLAAPVQAAAPEDGVPVPPAKPAELAQAAPVKRTPIAIFISRKTKKIYVRQDFEPLFDAAITIEHPELPLGTHVFTAMELMNDNTTFRWTAVSLPGEPPITARNSESEKQVGRRENARRRREIDKPSGELPPPQTPAQALSRIEIPQDVIDNISEMMVPGSSLIISDQGLGDETGDGTDFIVVTR